MRLPPNWSGPPALYPILSTPCGVPPNQGARTSEQPAFLMFPRAMIAATVLATLAFATPAAAAPTLEPLKPCYVSAGPAGTRGEGAPLLGGPGGARARGRHAARRGLHAAGRDRRLHRRRGRHQRPGGRGRRRPGD